MGRASLGKERSDWQRICKISVLALKPSWQCMRFAEALDFRRQTTITRNERLIILYTNVVKFNGTTACLVARGPLRVE